MTEQTYLTADGAKKLQAELDDLRGPKRTELAARLRDAIQQGDLSENADYHKAKEDQGFLEGRIQELEYVLRNVTIIDENPAQSDEVVVGSTVTIQEQEGYGDEPETYQVVGSKEADPRQGRISNESPIGRAVMGGRLGSLVTAETPAGPIKFKIIKID